MRFRRQHLQIFSVNGAFCIFAHESILLSRSKEPFLNLRPLVDAVHLYLIPCQKNNYCERAITVYMKIYFLLLRKEIRSFAKKRSITVVQWNRFRHTNTICWSTGNMRRLWTFTPKFSSRSYKAKFPSKHLSSTMESYQNGKHEYMPVPGSKFINLFNDVITQMGRNLTFFLIK